jgi:hypothetical protein
MGTPCAVTFACLYVAMLEHEVQYYMMLKGTLYDFKLFRFIDDIFGIFPNETMAIEYINCFNTIRKNNIKLTFEINNQEVNFLDITIFKGKRYLQEGTLDFKLFQKPFNTYLYLPSFSFHNKPIFKGYISSEIKRYRINNNNDEDFISCKQLLYDRLKVRGYSKRFLKHVFKNEYSRTQLLLNTNKDNPTKITPYTSIKTIPLIFKTILTQRQPILKIKEILDYSNFFKYDWLANSLFDTKRHTPVLCYKRSKNLTTLLTTRRIHKSIHTYSHKINDQ